MQHTPLRIGRIIDHAARFHPNRPVISRRPDDGLCETSWWVIRARALHVAQALAAMGLGRGDVVGVMGWNTDRMLELWYGVPGAGAVLHTLNPRLFDDQLVYIINHAGDRLLFVDTDLLPIVERIWPRLETVEQVIVLTDAERMPETPLPARDYEGMVLEQDGDFDWVAGDETDACGICYTSGTTGNPKGVVYTHRSNTLHAMTMITPDMLGLRAADRVMPVVPLFHANGWSIGYAAPMTGASMVLPGRDLSPAALYELLEMGVTVTAAVPTIWLMLLAHLDKAGLRLSSLKRVVIGGSSCPRAVIERFQDHYGVQVLHAWGMTEMSPVGTICSFKPEIEAMAPEARLDIQETVGHPPFGVDLRITDDEGEPLPWDGQTQGRLWARGASVVERYLHDEAAASDPAGWFDTGDVATMDPHGYVRITDRSKDIIKSGGEWISSIELENAALAHPDVAEAAAVGMPHEKWGERPVLVVVPRAEAPPEPATLLEVLARRFAQWQLPDDIVFVSEIPHTATGKISKLQLRQQLAGMGYVLPARS
ncbi:long-chain fatty acid--CoA ligase [Halovulum dunhuangense]|nr:long-chain fatty acid--CoA ligase [Halovulum dunhuangense]